jgi:hypothetical protein
MDADLMASNTSQVCYYVTCYFDNPKLQSESIKLGKKIFLIIVKGKAIPLQALTGPEGPRRLRLPDFETVGT